MKKNNLFFFLILASFLCLTVTLSYILNIWIDEAYTLNTTGQGIRYAWQQSINFELQSPFYFLILTIWRQISGSIFFARLFSVLCAAGTLFVVRKLARIYLPSVNPYCIVALAAYNPFIIWAALEIRLYAFGIFIFSLLLLRFHSIFILGKHSRFQIIQYFLIITVALSTHYYLLILFISFFVLLIVLRRWSQLKCFIIIHTISAIALIPVLFYIHFHLEHSLKTLKSHAGFLDAIRNLYGLLFEYILPLGWSPNIVGKIMRYLLTVFIISIVIFNRKKIGRNQIQLWTIFSTMFLAFVIVGKLSGLYFALSRHTFTIFLILIFSFFSLADLISVKRRRGLLIGSILAILICSAITIIRNYYPLAKSGDYLRVSSFIQKNEKVGQPILVFDARAEMPLIYYYHGINKIVPIPHKIDYKKYDVNKFVIQNEEEIVNALSKCSSGFDELWYLKAGGFFYLDVDFNLAVLEEFLNKNYSVEFTKIFYDAELKLLKIRAK